MFDSLLPDPPDRSSVVEDGLRGWLEAHRFRLVTTVERLAGPILEVATDTTRHGTGRLDRELADTAADARVAEDLPRDRPAPSGPHADMACVVRAGFAS